MTVLSSLCRVYRLLLRAYPPEFRERYADEMASVFRDRGREIAQSRGTWRLCGYMLSTGKDWFVTVLRERMDFMQRPSLLTLRWIFLFCVVLDLVLPTGLTITRSAPVCGAVLVMYGLLVLWATTNLDDGRRTALQTGTSWGLISGVILTAWSIGGYFVRSEGTMPIFLAGWSMVLIFGCWSIAGYQAARRTATASSGWLAGCWGGVVCALVKVTCAFLLLRTSLPGPSIGIVLVAAGQHLLEAPVIGAVLGAMAGLTARIVSKGHSSPTAFGLAGGK